MIHHSLFFATAEFQICQYDHLPGHHHNGVNSDFKSGLDKLSLSMASHQRLSSCDNENR